MVDQRAIDGIAAIAGRKGEESHLYGPSVCAVTCRSGRSAATKVGRYLTPIEVEDGSRDQTKSDGRHGRGPQNQPMGQNRAEHRGAKHGGAHNLKVRDPEQHDADDLHETCEIPKPLAQTDGVESDDHRFGADKLGASGAYEDEGQEGAQAEGDVFHHGRFRHASIDVGDVDRNKSKCGPDIEMRNSCALMRQAAGASLGSGSWRCRPQGPAAQRHERSASAHLIRIAFVALEHVWNMRVPSALWSLA